MASSRPSVRAAPASPSLLSPAGYDDDVASLRTLSDQDSDSEDDQILQGSRSTLELSRHDQSVLEAEEELEKLLTKPSPTHGLRRILGVHDAGSVRIGKREKRKRLRRVQRSLRKKNMENAEGIELDDLLYGVEEGFDDLSSLSSASTTSLDSGPRNTETVYAKVCLHIVLIPHLHRLSNQRLLFSRDW